MNYHPKSFSLITLISVFAFSGYFQIQATAALNHDFETEILLLSGKDSVHTVEWDFKVNGGRQANEWAKIPVPSNWEMQGFGTYHYWRDWGEDAAPDSEAVYRHNFTAPASFEGRHVELVFGAAMTDTTVFLNGEQVGPTHQGGFYQFSYDVSDFLKLGEENELEVKVQKFSSNESVNLAEREADYWLFGGIYRPVWLECKPSTHIDRLAVDARHDGSISVKVFTTGTTLGHTVSAAIIDEEGHERGQLNPERLSEGQEIKVLTGKVTDIQPWTAETPNLYTLVVDLSKEGNKIHSVRKRIGFRTLELKPGQGFYVNGQKVLLKGSNRHSIWPDTGRATNEDLSIADVELMKEMNMNAVRMSHYPPDPHFLDACDELGLYVIDELGGWQKSYDTEVGKKLVREMIERDVNHPSIVFWSNGNEGGWNTELDDEFAKYDPQNRVVIHPWANFNGINTSHYEDYNSGVEWFFNGQDLIMPTEFLHGLYDGGHGAGLNDWWQRMLSHPLGLGGFLWAFADEGVKRDDRNGLIDVAGNQAPDGIVGPYREKEGSFYTIKEIWAPVYFKMSEIDSLPPSFDGRLDVENRYDFTNLKEVVFTWKLSKLTGASANAADIGILQSGTCASPDVKPWQKGCLFLDLPKHWYEQSDLLSLTATDPSGNEIYTWNWSTTPAAEISHRLVPERTYSATHTTALPDGSFEIRNGEVTAVIDTETGRLITFNLSDYQSPLKNGPQLLNFPVDGLSCIEISGGLRVESKDSILRFIEWKLDDTGYLSMEYAFRVYDANHYDYFGVSFNYADESQVTGVKWFGKGPYRVWKNRRKGVEFGVWEKAYNDTITGLSWDYPEFKGFHDDVAFARLSDKRLNLDIIVENEALNLRLFTPSEAPEPRNTHVEFPEGDISFLHAFTPIGTKFKQADQHGPEGQKSWSHRGGQIFTAKLYFHLSVPDHN